MHGKLTALETETTQLLNTLLSYLVPEHHIRYFTDISEMIIKKNIVARKASISSAED